VSASKQNGVGETGAESETDFKASVVTPRVLKNSELQIERASKGLRLLIRAWKIGAFQER
jgi:hypothetical protein